MKEEQKQEIIKLLKKDKAVIGTKEVIKKINNDEISKVFLASNTPPKTKQRIEELTQAFDVKLEKMGVRGKQFGAQCGKPFTILVLGVKKE